MDSPLDNQKQELRMAMRTTLRSLSAAEKSESAENLCQKVHSYLKTLADGPLVIASFAALPTEPDLSPLLTMLPEHTFVYPKCDSSGAMDFYPVQELQRSYRRGSTKSSSPPPIKSPLSPSIPLLYFSVLHTHSQPAVHALAKAAATTTAHCQNALLLANSLALDLIANCCPRCQQ